MVAVLLVLSVWSYSRWDVWFHNPDELPYVASSVPCRILLTFGNHGEDSRFVSWMCDSVVDPSARLLLACAGDTTTIPAQGEVFVSRNGKAAYYRAEAMALLPETAYDYAVESRGIRSRWYRFHTHDPHSENFSFLYVGDVQDSLDGKVNRLLRRAVEEHPAVEFVLFGGDLIERPTDAYWAETFRSIDSLSTALPVLTVTGNHDYLKYLIRKCERRFALCFPYFLQGMEQRRDANHLFSLRYHNTDLFLLDSDRGAWFLLQQRRWLEGELSASTARHKIVVTHHPLYSVKRKNNNLIQRWMFNGPIQEHQADLVLQGHEHAYTRCTANQPALRSDLCTTPPLYLISHCSPKNYDIHPTDRFHPVLSGSRYYQIVEVCARDITVRTYDANTGEEVDRVRINVHHSMPNA